MRNILLVLLLANILVLFWYNWIDTPPRLPQGAAQPAADLPVRRPAVPVEEAKVLLAEPQACFLSAAQPLRENAETLAAQYTETSVAPSLIEEAQQVVVDYWVRIDGFSKSSAARAAVTDLRRAGIRDSYVVRDEDVENTWLISLGVYRNQVGAESIAAAAVELGFPAVLVPRFEVSAIYRVLLKGDESDLRAALGGTELTGSYVPCDHASADGPDISR